MLVGEVAGRASGSSLTIKLRASRKSSTRPGPAGVPPGRRRQRVLFQHQARRLLQVPHGIDEMIHELLGHRGLSSGVQGAERCALTEAAWTKAAIAGVASDRIKSRRRLELRAHRLAQERHPRDISDERPRGFLGLEQNDEAASLAALCIWFAVFEASQRASASRAFEGFGTKLLQPCLLLGLADNPELERNKIARVVGDLRHRVRQVRVEVDQVDQDVRRLRSEQSGFRKRTQRRDRPHNSCPASASADRISLPPP